MASAEGGSVPSGVVYGEECPLSSRLKGLGERRELPQRGPGQSPGRKRILAYFECHRTLIFCTYMTKSGGTTCISVPPLQILGGSTPMSVPVVYTMATKDMFGGRRRPSPVCPVSICRPRLRKANQRTCHGPDSPQMLAAKSIIDTKVYTPFINRFSLNFP